MKNTSLTRQSVVALSICGVAALAGPAQAAVVSFQDGVNGYAGTADAFVRADRTVNGTEPTNSESNFNTTQIIVAGPNSQTRDPVTLPPSLAESHGLIRFDNIFGSGPNQIPLDATINSATLTFRKSSGFGTLELYQLANGLSFGETTVTWDSLTGGIQRGNGSEVNTTAIGSLSFANGNVPEGGTGSYNVLSSINAWKGGLNNNGWALLQSNSTAGAGVFLGSSDSTALADRPLLTVDFTPVPEPTALAALALGGLAALRRRRR